MTLPVWRFDRSRHLDGKACPRRRFLGFHFNGTGIQRKAVSLPLCFGSAFHEGAAILLQAFAFIRDGEKIDLAVGVAKNFLKEVFDSRGVLY